MPLDTSTYALSLLRVDGRRWNELRRMHGSISTQAAADGSSYLCIGNTQVLCTVTGPSEIRGGGLSSTMATTGGDEAQRERAGVSVNISVAGFSGTERRAGARSGGQRTDRRIGEMQATVQSTLASALFLERYPRSTIAVGLHVLAADGGVLAACLNAATLALVDAGIPMADYVCACTAGSTANTLGYAVGGGGGGGGGGRGGRGGSGGSRSKGDDAEDTTDPLLDLNAQEELELPFLTVGTLGASERVTCLLLETRVRIDRVESMLAVAVDGCKQIREILDGIVRRHGRTLLENSVA